MCVRLELLTSMGTLSHSNDQPARGVLSLEKVCRRITHLGNFAGVVDPELLHQFLDHVGVGPATRHFVTTDRRIDKRAV